jgi:soluble lytic murein transglycosylase-like protein
MSDKSELVMPKPQPQVRDSLDQKLQPYESMIASAAKDHDLNPSLLKAVIASESGGNARAVSSKHAKGLMQLVDTTAAAMGVQNVWDPEQNIQGGAKYLQSLLDRFGGNIAHAVASYNAGPAAVEKHGGIPPFKETRAYVDKVLKYLQHFEQQGIASNDQD